VISRKRHHPRIAQARAGAGVLGTSSLAYVLPAGTPARTVPCFTCGEPAGAEPVLIENAVTWTACPDDGTHLIGAAFVRHLRCDPLSDEAAAQRASMLLAQAVC